MQHSVDFIIKCFSAKYILLSGLMSSISGKKINTVTIIISNDNYSTSSVHNVLCSYRCQTEKRSEINCITWNKNNTSAMLQNEVIVECAFTLVIEDP